MYFLPELYELFARVLLKSKTGNNGSKDIDFDYDLPMHTDNGKTNFSELEVNISM